MRKTSEFKSKMKRLRSNRGTAMLEFAVSVPLLMILLAGALDFGTACYVAIEVTNAARAGAQYGAQNGQTTIDTAGMELAAKNEASNISTTSSTAAGKTYWVTGYPLASYGCECANGTGIKSNTTSCSCTGTSQQVNFVLVTTQATYNPIIPWKGYNSTYTFNGMAKLRVGTQ